MTDALEDSSNKDQEGSAEAAISEEESSVGHGYPREYLRHRVKIGPTSSFTLNVRGESLSPTYVRGQL